MPFQFVYDELPVVEGRNFIPRIIEASVIEIYGVSYRTCGQWYARLQWGIEQVTNIYATQQDTYILDTYPITNI